MEKSPSHPRVDDGRSKTLLRIGGVIPGATNQSYLPTRGPTSTFYGIRAGIHPPDPIFLPVAISRDSVALGLGALHDARFRNVLAQVVKIVGNCGGSGNDDDDDDDPDETKDGGNGVAHERRALGRLVHAQVSGAPHAARSKASADAARKGKEDRGKRPDEAAWIQERKKRARGGVG